MSKADGEKHLHRCTCKYSTVTKNMAVIIYSDDADKFALYLRAQIIRSMWYEREHQRTLCTHRPAVYYMHTESVWNL